MKFSQPSSQDEFIRLLERKRAAGLKLSEEDYYIPIECPDCGEVFSVHETAYRQWRDGEMEQMLHPQCMSFFVEAPFSRMTCTRCGEPSGDIPSSICCRLADSEDGWVCSECTSQAMTAKVESRFSDAPIHSKGNVSMEPIRLQDLIGANLGRPTPADTLRICEALGVTSESANDPVMHRRIVETFFIEQTAEVVQRAARQHGIDLNGQQSTSIARCFTSQGSRPMQLTSQERSAAVEILCMALRSDGVSESDARSDAQRMVAFFERGPTALHKVGDSFGCLVLAVGIIGAAFATSGTFIFLLVL